MKLPKLPKLPSLKSLHLPSRITMERLLIVSAAALVVVLAGLSAAVPCTISSSCSAFWQLSASLLKSTRALPPAMFYPRCQHPNHRGRIAGCRNDLYRLLV